VPLFIVINFLATLLLLFCVGIALSDGAYLTAVLNFFIALVNGAMCVVGVYLYSKDGGSS